MKCTTSIPFQICSNHFSCLQHWLNICSSFCKQRILIMAGLWMSVLCVKFNVKVRSHTTRCFFDLILHSCIPLQVGMQNSSLGVVLATSHFTSPLVALPPAMSAVIMNIMGSSLGVIWRCIEPSDQNKIPSSDLQ